MRLHARIGQQRVDRFLVAVDDVEHAVRQRPPSGTVPRCRIGTDGSRSDGLRMKVLPHAMAGAPFHSGIMAGKLNGVMPATTPSGWRIE